MRRFYSTHHIIKEVLAESGWTAEIRTRECVGQSHERSAPSPLSSVVERRECGAAPHQNARFSRLENRRKI